MTQHAHIVDDDEAVRDSLDWLLNTRGISSVAYPSAEAFLEAWTPEFSGCILLDIRMENMSGTELFERLLEQGCRLPVIFLTGHGDVPMAVRALKKGAVDFIEKPHEAERLVLAVLNALRMDDERRKQTNRHDDLSVDLATRLATLSEREREVLDRILEGKQTRQITEELCISVKTVEFHRARIREKLGVTTQAQLFSLFIASEGDA